MTTKCHQGCYAIHNHNCEACEIIVESNTISGIQGGGKKVIQNMMISSCISFILYIIICNTGCEAEGEIYMRILLGGAGGHLQELQDPVSFQSNSLSHAWMNL